MAVPDFQSMMLPILQACADGEVHTLGDAYKDLAHRFGLSETELSEMLPSSKQTRLQNRTQWAKFYLVKAQLLEMAGRGRFRLTERGRELLATAPNAITIRKLMDYPEFREFRSGAPANTSDAGPAQAEGPESPQELLETSYQGIRQALAQDLLDLVRSCSPRFFEHLVVDLLVAMGYGGSHSDAGEVLRQSGDEGVDGVIKEDRLGLDAVYVQAKRWRDSVGRPVVQAFAGSLMGHKARKGVLITTSSFSPQAQEYAQSIQERNIVLIDGERLAQLMVDFDIGVSTLSTYVIKKVDSDYFQGGA